MLYQRMSKPHLTVHGGIWKLSRRITTHSWESTATSLRRPQPPNIFPTVGELQLVPPLTLSPAIPGCVTAFRVQLWLLSQWGSSDQPNQGSHILPAHCTQTAGDYTENKKKDQPTRENWREVPKQWLCWSIASPVSTPSFFAFFSVSKYFKAKIWSARLGSKQAKFLL